MTVYTSSRVLPSIGNECLHPHKIKECLSQILSKKEKPWKHTHSILPFIGIRNRQHYVIYYLGLCSKPACRLWGDRRCYGAEGEYSGVHWGMWYLFNVQKNSSVRIHLFL